MIPFQKPYGLDKALPLMEQVLLSGKTEGDGPMGMQCRAWLLERMPAADALMTSSGTASLEAAFHVMGLLPGDEVILPAHAYPADATAILLAGGTPVFAPSDPVRLALDPESLPGLLTPRTRALLVIHYGGQCADMDAILAFARAHGLLVVEDAAQAFLAKYKGQYAGTMGDFGCFSFHGTKDIVAGEGGALLVNNSRFVQPLRVWRRNGTNRDAFVAGEVDRYEWVALGSSLAPSELCMALLASQLSRADTVTTGRRRLFRVYATHFAGIMETDSASSRLAGCARVLPDVEENGHLFWLLLHNGEQALRLVRFLAARGIDARTHFVPLQESRYGSRFILPGQTFPLEHDMGRRLVRLPMYFGMTDMEQAMVIDSVEAWLERELAAESEAAADPMIREGDDTPDA